MKIRKPNIFFSLLALFLVICIITVVYLYQSSKIIESTTIPLNTSNSKITTWVAQKDQTPGIHLAHWTNHSQEKYILYFNKFKDQLHYSHYRSKIRYSNKTLSIYLSKEDVTSDIYVSTTLLSAFTLNEKPEKINVYYNESALDPSIEEKVLN